MTNASDVHLFDWIRENASIIGTFFVVSWALIVWAVNSFFKARDSRFATIEQLNACRDKNTEEHSAIRHDIAKNHSEVKDLFINHLGDK